MARQMRYSSSLALLLILAMLLAACGGSGESGQTGKVTLTFWNGLTGPDRPAVEALVKKFNDSHPDIEIQMDITPWDSLLQKVPSAMSTGQGPDLLGVTFTYLPQYAKSGYLMDISSFYEEGGNLDPENFPAGLVDVLQHDGTFYGAPMNFATLMMYYNKDLFAQAGLDPDSPPQTWEDWIDAIKTLTRSEGGARQYGLAIGEHNTIPNWPIFLWGNGGNVIRDGAPALSDAKTVEALELWGGLVRDEGISPVGLSGAEADKLFESQKAAMEVTGPWMTNGFSEAGINFGVAPVPTGPAGPVTLADSVLIMASKTAESPEAVQAFMDFWNSRESQLFWAVETGFPPTRLDLADDPRLAEDEWAPKFAAVAPHARFYLQGQDKFAQINDDVFVPMIQAITHGESSAQEAAQHAQQQLNSLLKP